MQKFLIVLLIIITLIFYPNLVFALGDLYYIEHTDENFLKEEITNAFIKNNLIIIQANPYVGVSYMGDDYAIAIINPDSGGINYYFESSSGSKINDIVLSNIQHNGAYISKCFNDSITFTYSNAAQQMYSQYIDNSEISTNIEEINNNQIEYNKYNFEEDEQIPFSSDNVLKGRVVQLAKGTKIPAYLQNSIDTSTAQTGDKVLAVLTDDLKSGNYIIAPQGSIVYGSLSEAKCAKRGLRDGKVVIEFEHLSTPDGTKFNIEAETIEFKVTQEGKIARVVRRSAGMAVLGTLAGIAYAVCTTDVATGIAIAIGGGAGLAAGAVSGVAQKGDDAEIPSLTQLEIILKSPLTATAIAD